MQFVRLLFESGYYLRAVFIKLGMEDKQNPLSRGRWSGCRRQGVYPKRYCHACYFNEYLAQGIRFLRRCWRGRRWVGGGRTCSRRLLFPYTMPSTILKLLYTLCWYKFLLMLNACWLSMHLSFKVKSDSFVDCKNIWDHIWAQTRAQAQIFTYGWKCACYVCECRPGYNWIDV